MRRIHHPPLAHEDTHMRHVRPARTAPPARGPEEQIARLGLRAR